MTPLTSLAFMSFGFGELIIIGTVALLVFGGQLPDVMRSLGRAYARFKDGLDEVSKPVRDELRDVRAMPDPKSEIRQALTEANQVMDEPVADDGRADLDPETDVPEYSEGIDEPEGEPSPWPVADTQTESEPKPAPPSKDPSPPPSFNPDDDDLLTP